MERWPAAGPDTVTAPPLFSSLAWNALLAIARLRARLSGGAKGGCTRGVGKPPG